ncbi:MAG TPA: ABC transporter ATP-binding protein, partial [Clostridia bacterium]|nr:ABC transporter ATP-binding protein [Clostridia bacterium]
MIKELLKHARSSLKYTLITPCLVALEVVVEVMIPYVTSALIDNGIQKGNMRYVGIASVILLALAATGMLLGILSGWSATKGSTGFAKNLMDDMYANIQNFSFGNIDKFSTSSLITRLTTDVMNVRQSYQMTSRLATRCPIMLIMSVIMAFTISPKIAWIYLAVAPVLMIGLLLIIKFAFPLFEKVFKNYDKMNLVVRENVKGVRVVKSFNSQEKEIDKFKGASGDIFKNYSRAERLLALNSPLMQICVYTCMILISWFCAKYIVAGDLEVGALTALISYTMSILISLMMFSMVFVLITISKASAERIVEVLREEPSIVNPENPIYDVENGDIEFKNVGFSYVGDCNKECMSNINLSIKSGEMVGILGGTGSGKTTLVSMLPRLYDATSGEVIVGGRNVKEYDIKALRDSVSVVLQKNVLFSGTLRDNMKWGNPDV